MRMTLKQQLAALKKARSVIKTPAKWCQGASARDERGMGVDPLSKTAKRFCMAGAICVALEKDDKAISTEEQQLVKTLGFETFSDMTAFNDDEDGYVNHASVIKKFDRAIASLEKKIK